jgi:hypothetical protein
MASDLQEGDASMPFINGKYYINPTFGRAIELARMSEEEQRAAEPQHEPAHKGRPGGSGDSYDPATTPEGVANQIYNETAGLRTTDQRGNGLEATGTCSKHASQ